MASSGSSMILSGGLIGRDRAASSIATSNDPGAVLTIRSALSPPQHGEIYLRERSAVKFSRIKSV